MVRFVDLDDELPSLNSNSYSYTHIFPSDVKAERSLGELSLNADLAQAHASATERLFTQILQCYPLLETIVQYLDLNDLHNLALTCRPFRKILLPQKSNLIDRALRCNQPDAERLSRLCVRDMVRACMTCSQYVCRNCTYKRKPAGMAGRKRQLCRGCRTDPTVLNGEECDCPTNSWMCYACGIFTDRITYHYSNRWSARIPIANLPHQQVPPYSPSSSSMEPELVPKYLFPCARAFVSTRNDTCPFFEHNGGKETMHSTDTGDIPSMRVGIGPGFFRVLPVKKLEELEDCDSKGLVKGSSMVPGEASWCGWCRRVIKPDGREIAEAALNRNSVYATEAAMKETRYLRMRVQPASSSDSDF